MRDNKFVRFWINIYFSILDIFNDLPLAFRGLIIGPLLLITGISSYEWLLREFPSRPPSQVNEQRIQHPNYHNIASRALSEFSVLSPAEKNSLVQRLKDNITPVATWLADLEQSNYQILCLGESHRESTRQFLSEVIFKAHRFDNLFLEATDKQLAQIYRRLSSQRSYYPMLDADILQLLRSVKNFNPAVSIHAIEASQQQRASSRVSIKSREDSILANFWRHYAPQARNIVLIGAMHCSDSAPWFYAKMTQESVKRDIQKMHSVRVLNEHEEGTIEAFVYFLDEIGIEQKDFVITNAKFLAASIQQWFPLTAKLILEPYQAVIIYR